MTTIAGRPPSRLRRWTGVALLLLPVMGLACVPLYARDGPRLLDVPFFYWYQLAWVGLSMVCMTGAAFLIPTNRTHPTYPSNLTNPSEPPRATDNGGPQ